MEDASEQKLIQLEPFAHQVGGHSSMLCLDGATVAKPLVTREQRFYETLPASLRPFVPSFLGALEVHVLQGEGGYVTHAATPPPHYRPHLGIQTRRSRIRVHDSGDIEIEGENEGMVFEDDNEDREQIATKIKEEDFSQLEDEELQKLERGTRPSIGHALNPWVLRCHRESLSGLTPGMSQNFILLENLTARFKQPCVLDLKVGTRQYGDSASAAKVRSKMKKVATTTSGKLGLRLGGMQVYQVTTRRFLCRNKLYGRALTVEGFRMTLVQFLHNGWCIRLDIVKPLLERLEMLEEIMTRLGAARFYTCSLLCLYEGELKTPSTTPLSPSTPAPPITPGPSFSFPHVLFSCPANRFNFPSVSQITAETNQPLSNNDKIADKENLRQVSDARTSSGAPISEQKNQAFVSSFGGSASIVATSSTVQDNEVHRISSCTNSTSDGLRKTSLSKDTSELPHLVKEMTSLGSKGLSNTQGMNSSGVSSLQTVINSNSYSALQGNYSAENGAYSSDGNPHKPPIRGQESGVSFPSHSNPQSSKETRTPENFTTNENLKLSLKCAIEPPQPDQAANAKLCIIEDQVTKCQRKTGNQRKEAIGRSVSADSMSYSRLESRTSLKDEVRVHTPKNIKKVNCPDVNVNGYVKGEKESWMPEFTGHQKERSHSLEPQISLYTSNNQTPPHFDNSSVSSYNPIAMTPLVDVRLIDFAHSTHKGLADPVIYAGPDQGFLFGLHNLIILLRDIVQEAMTATERL